MRLFSFEKVKRTSNHVICWSAINHVQSEIWPIIYLVVIVSRVRVNEKGVRARPCIQFATNQIGLFSGK